MQHIADSYDLSREFNSNIIPVNILDAITYCAEAWSAVTETTIKNCWRKTGILPPDVETSTVDELNVDDIIELEMNNLQSSIDSLGWENSILAEQYMNVDEEIEGRNINDDEIVSMINRSPLEEDEIEKPIIHPTVSVKSALESLQVLSDFLSNPPAEFTYDKSILFKIRSLKSDLLTYSISKKKQTSIDNFIRND